MNQILLSLALGALIIGNGVAFAENTQKSPSQYAPDNTARNASDNKNLSAKEPNADTQGRTEGSNELIAGIRKEIVNNDGLSTYAHNIKIIASDDNTITLRGPVTSSSEKNIVVQIARNHANRVVDQLEVTQ